MDLETSKGRVATLSYLAFTYGVIIEEKRPGSSPDTATLVSKKKKERKIRGGRNKFCLPKNKSQVHKMCTFNFIQESAGFETA